jgi:RHH-type proline utilization regulon transcriptional repressor/proline dehydrogenase/delta 1-pyrroline-5-carboxylate dehydrogenase
MAVDARALAVENPPMRRDEAFERQVREIGGRIFELAGGGVPSVFDSRWWSGKVMDWSMKDQAFKIEMFRFVDVFPTLRTSEEIARHMREYFCRPGQDFPAAFQWGLKAVSPGSVVAKAAAAAVRKNMAAMAKRFIGGASPAEAIPVLRRMRAEGAGFTVDLLGEHTVSEVESKAYLQRYDELLETLVTEARGWEEVPAIDCWPHGSVPKVNISIKVSALYSQLDPIDFEGGVQTLAERLHPLFKKAHGYGAFLNLDVEQNRYKDLTLAAFKRVLDDPSLQSYEHAGIVSQAYSRDSFDDVRALLAWAKGRGTPVTVRLVKGAYWDYETVLAAQNGHACPVYTEKAATDLNYERIASFLVENRRWLRPALGSHNVRSLAAGLAAGRRAGAADGEIELQMLHGMAEPLKHAAKQMGYRLREYVPIGELIPGMAYLVRRLLENTSNEGFLRSTFIDGASHEALLRPPEPRQDLDSTDSEAAPSRLTDHAAPGRFVNEAPADFTLEKHREAFQAALGRSRKELARGAKAKPMPLLVGGKELRTDATLPSTNPARPEQVLRHVCQAGVGEGEAALEAAHKAFLSWRDVPAQNRAAVLFRAARSMRQRRHDLSALQVHEVGKTWREADADVCEAIDFLEYYGREMIRLGRPQRMGDAPGEQNDYFYQPRGVGLILAPWNFPLAILTGMAAAAMVAGNTILVKPSGQSPLIAWELIRAFSEAKAPPGVVSFVPCRGSELGAYLVAHPGVAFIAFTGSMEVGLGIVETAGKTLPAQPDVKRVIAEMGGKNAVIVDTDADLDEAVLGVMHSAFGFQGQKCSACSRVVVLDGAHDEFLDRLVEATRSLKIGPPWDPATSVGPVVDEAQHRSIAAYQALAREEGEVVLQREVPSEGYFAGPTIVTGIRAEHRLAQEEVFGPVLAVMRAKDFSHALEIANGTRFALTGGLFSRSPANIARARREFRVGNLYINRGCTGALVERQPFGGFKMSGMGSKAGGPDYLQQFMEPRTITENTMRRGFTPEA